MKASWCWDFSCAFDFEHSCFERGGLLCDVSTIWSVKSLLEPEQEVD